jgi:hypothetical protein
VSFILNDYR